MAFQMIPPRVSSSPPPLDSLPTITYQPEDEEDDFGNFSGEHNVSFDITGLSDKLPPTPATSPSKTFPNNAHCVAATTDHLNEKIIEDRISLGTSFSTEKQIIECSPKLPSGNGDFGDFQSNMEIKSNFNGEKARNIQEITEEKGLDNDDDFGDFECSFGDTSKPVSNECPKIILEENNKNLSNCKDDFTEDGAIIDRSSQILASSISKNVPEYKSGSENSLGCRSTSVNNSNNLNPPRSPPPAMVSPPPMDKLAPRRMSEDGDDEFGGFSTGQPGITDNEDDDFGDFTSTNNNSFSTNFSSNNTIIGSSIKLGYSPGHQEIIENQEDKVNEINTINRSKGLCSEQLENCFDSTVEQNSRGDIEVHKSLSKESNTAIGENWHSADSGELVEPEEIAGGSLSDEISTNTNQIIENKSVQNNIEIEDDTRTLQLNETNKVDTPLNSLNAISSSKKSDLNESFQGNNELNGDIDDDFGEFANNDIQSNDEKTLHNVDNDDDDKFGDFVDTENAKDETRTTKKENIDSD
ncbi:unnamed protein product, partial [Meganyctiphanes norvegica]